MVIAGNLPKINQELGQAHTLLMLDINEHLYQSRKVALLHLSVQQLTFQDASSSRELFHCYAFSLTYVSARTYTKGKKIMKVWFLCIVVTGQKNQIRISNFFGKMHIQLLPRRGKQRLEGKHRTDYFSVPTQIYTKLHLLSYFVIVYSVSCHKFLLCIVSVFTFFLFQVPFLHRLT